MFTILSEGPTTYEIKIQAFNEVGAGDSSIPLIARIQQRSSSDKTLSSGAVIGVVIGAILFLILLLIILFFVRKNILKARHAKSVMVRQLLLIRILSFYFILRRICRPFVRRTKAAVAVLMSCLIFEMFGLNYLRCPSS